MVRKRLKQGAALVAVFAAWVSPAFSNETITYSYDALGRLVATTTSGTVNNSLNTSTTFDPAGNRANYTVSGVVIPTAATLSIGSATVTEGGALVFTVTRSGITTSAVSASYASASGTATSGSDFTAAAATVSFAANETSKTISVTTIDDAAIESAETMTVTLSAPSSGAVLGTAVGTGTINDNDLPPPSFAISAAASVTEGGSLVYTVTKTGSTSSSFSVNFASANGTATAGSDYTANSGTLTFLAADTTKTVTIATIDDAVVESAETVLVNLSSATGGATITNAQGSGTINDNDVTGPSFSVNDQTVVEGVPLVFTITKTGSTSSTYTVNFATANGTATAGTHYVAQSGTLTFTSAQTTATVSVTTIDLARVSGNKTMFLNLSSPSGGATLSDSQGQGTIGPSDSVCHTCNNSAPPPDPTSSPPPEG